MNVIVALAHRFDRTPDGRVWTQTMFGYPFWTRYLDVFSSVRPVARLRDVDSVPEGSIRADGRQVAFAEIPHYIGPLQYIRRSVRVRRSAQQAVGKGDAIILRLGCRLATCIEPLLRRTGRPYGVEVVCDPYDVFAPGSVSHPLRPLFRWWLSRRMLIQCARASAAAYVTESAIQRRYPAAPNAFSTNFSSVELPSEAFVTGARTCRNGAGPVRVVTVGSLSQRYKGVDVLIDAVALCLRDGLDICLDVVGDGRHRAELQSQARRCGANGQIRFLGQLPAGEAVREQLDRADLFVLPSRTEGLPRAMIEAMARGLPCIGSKVGGIPELLPEEDLAPAGDAVQLAAAIRAAVTDPARMVRMSARNFQKAAGYRDDVLRDRRVSFYQEVKRRTESWLPASHRRLPQAALATDTLEQ